MSHLITKKFKRAESRRESSNNESSEERAKPSIGARIWAFIKQHWFLEGLVFAIALAAAYPPLGKKGGYIHAEYTISYVAVALIFVLSGMSMKTKVLAKAILSWKTHLVVQIISLGITPLIGYALKSLLFLTSFDKSLAAGIAIACATPTTISSNVLMTKQANGSESIALTNAVIGNILGVFISPVLIFAYVGTISGVTFEFARVFMNLAITVLAPLIVGQLIQYFLPKAVAWISKKVPLAIVNSSLLLLMVYGVFCDTFSSNLSVDVVSLVLILIICLVLFLLFSAFSFFVSRVLKFSKPDTVAIVMCAATKTVALGIPLINVLFASSPNIGLLSTPLLVYHAEQLVVGAFIVTWMKGWVGTSAADIETGENEAESTLKPTEPLNPQDDQDLQNEEASGLATPLEKNSSSELIETNSENQVPER